MPDAKNRPDSEHKLLGLEVLRFLSAVSVLLWHYKHFSFVADAPTNYVSANQPFYALLRPFYDAGFFGVQVFWCISGYIFFWKYRQPIADGLVKARRFFVLRFSRLYPLHLLTLAAVGLMQIAYVGMHGHAFVYQANDLPNLVKQLFMASDWWVDPVESFNGPIWSISLEVLVYVLFFVLLRLFGGSPWVNLGVLAVCLSAWALGVPHKVFHCAAFFYAGGLAAIARGATRPDGRVLDMGALAYLVTVPAIAWAVGLLHVKGIAAPLLLACVPVLLYVFAHRLSAGPRWTSAIEAAGNMTYASYLLHVPLQLAIALGFAWAGRPIPMYESGFFLAYMGAILLMSWWTYRAFELPAQQALRNWMGGSPSPRATLARRA